MASPNSGMSLPGVRIKQARQRGKLSQRALADAAGVSATTISKYERGKSKPGSEVLLRLAEALDVDVSFFLRPERVGTIEPAFRKLARLGKKDERQLVARIRDWLERYLTAEEIVRPSPVTFDVPENFPRRVASMDDVENATLALRRAWDIGTDPIEDLTALLEQRGVRVGVIEADDDFDACTFEAEIDGGVPVIVTREGLPGDRQRFNLAHELGHLLLETSNALDEEDASNRFAGALLAPADGIRNALGSPRRHVTIEELHVLKHTHGISMQALVFRLRASGIFNKKQAGRVHRLFRKKGWHKNEPGEPVVPERPERFRMLVLNALAEDLIGERRARELYGDAVQELASDTEAVPA